MGKIMHVEHVRSMPNVSDVEDGRSTYSIATNASATYARPSAGVQDIWCPRSVLDAYGEQRNMFVWTSWQ